MATLLQLRGLVRTKAGLPSNDALVTDANLNDIINEANHAFENEADWPWLEAQETVAIAANASNFTPAADYARTIAVRIDTDDHELERQDIATLDRLANATGRPHYWGAFAQKVEFRPKAGTTYSMVHRYIKTEPELTADGNSPLSPIRWHYIIVEYATHLAWRRAQDEGKAAQALAAYNSFVRQAKSRSNLVSQDEGGGVGGDKAP